LAPVLELKKTNIASLALILEWRLEYNKLRTK